VDWGRKHKAVGEEDATWKKGGDDFLLQSRPIVKRRKGFTINADPRSKTTNHLKTKKNGPPGPIPGLSSRSARNCHPELRGEQTAGTLTPTEKDGGARPGSPGPCRAIRY